MEKFAVYLSVALGSALGGMGRYWLTGLVSGRMRESFPWGTLVVNVTGSFIIGLLAALPEPEARWLAGLSFRPFLMVGICGGYTTFSSFSLETLGLLRNGEMLQAGANVMASVFLCLIAVWLGHTAGQALNR